MRVCAVREAMHPSRTAADENADSEDVDGGSDDEGRSDPAIDRYP